MYSLMLLSAAIAAPPDATWRFVDQTHHHGRSVVMYQTMQLAKTPTQPLHADDRTPDSATFGTITLGYEAKLRVGIVWHAESSTVWLDADADGRFATSERHHLGATPLEVRVAIPFAKGKTPERTLLVRKRGEGIACAVRGFTTGSIRVGDKAYSAMLIDGNGDGCFDKAGADRVWLDLDDDGKFEPIAEQFLLGTAVAIDKTAILLLPDADGLHVRIRERPNETGTLRLQINHLPSAEILELKAHYVSEFGELAVIHDVKRPATVAAGKFRIDSLEMVIKDADGQVWQYWFNSESRNYDVTIDQGRESMHTPLAGLRMAVDHDGVGKPGETVTVRPNVVAGSLYMMGCDIGRRTIETTRGAEATILLCEPGSGVLDQANSGFN